MSVTAEKDSRRIRRINLPLPIRVEHNITPSSSLDEVTRLVDVSAFGAGFNLSRPIKRGRLLKMTIPLSRQLRNYDFMEPQYTVWGIVCHCIPVRDKKGERYAIGTAFIGKYPPRSYSDDPAKLYQIASREESHFWRIEEASQNPDDSHLPKKDRRHTRYQIPISITLEVLDEIGNTVSTETSVTENISIGGASVFTNLNVAVGSFLRITSEQYSVAITSIVRGSRVANDGVTRLHIEFFDRYFPFEGIE